MVEYGENVLAIPGDEGFDLAAWLVPGAALLTAAFAIGIALRAWGRVPRLVSSRPKTSPRTPRPPSASTPTWRATTSAAGPRPWRRPSANLASGSDSPVETSSAHVARLPGGARPHGSSLLLHLGRQPPCRIGGGVRDDAERRIPARRDSAPKSRWPRTPLGWARRAPRDLEVMVCHGDARRARSAAPGRGRGARGQRPAARAPRSRRPAVAIRRRRRDAEDRRAPETGQRRVAGGAEAPELRQQPGGPGCGAARRGAGADGTRESPRPPEPAARDAEFAVGGHAEGPETATPAPASCRCPESLATKSAHSLQWARWCSACRDCSSSARPAANAFRIGSRSAHHSPRSRARRLARSAGRPRG